MLSLMSKIMIGKLCWIAVAVLLYLAWKGTMSWQAAGPIVFLLSVVLVTVQMSKLHFIYRRGHLIGEKVKMWQHPGWLLNMALKITVYSVSWWLSMDSWLKEVIFTTVAICHWLQMWDWYVEDIWRWRQEE